MGPPDSGSEPTRMTRPADMRVEPLVHCCFRLAAAVQGAPRAPVVDFSNDGSGKAAGGRRGASRGVACGTPRAAFSAVRCHESCPGGVLHHQGRTLRVGISPTRFRLLRRQVATRRPLATFRRIVDDFSPGTAGAAGSSAAPTQPKFAGPAAAAGTRATAPALASCGDDRRRGLGRGPVSDDIAHYYGRGDELGRGGGR